MLICFVECSGGKVQQMLTGIQSSDEGQQLQSVIEMCQVKRSMHMPSKRLNSKNYLKTKELNFCCIVINILRFKSHSIRILY